jgi:hypothetical protein
MTHAIAPGAHIPARGKEGRPTSEPEDEASRSDVGCFQISCTAEPATHRIEAIE